MEFLGFEIRFGGERDVFRDRALEVVRIMGIMAKFYYLE